jgi:hypothetical protein
MKELVNNVGFDPGIATSSLCDLGQAVIFSSEKHIYNTYL